MASSFIRKYNPQTDFDAAIHVFRETCDDFLKVEPVWTIGSYIWCRPYLLSSCSTCFVVDDGNGQTVGYIVGVADSDDFCKRWQTEYLPQVDAELDSLPQYTTDVNDEVEKLKLRSGYLLSSIRTDPEGLVFASYREDLHRYGHLHIDILPSHQRLGFGKQLIQAFCSAVKEEGCECVYLGMAGSNESAGRFYEACGFQRLPKVLDGGTSGELGRTSKRDDGGQTIYFVIDV